MRNIVLDRIQDSQIKYRELLISTQCAYGTEFFKANLDGILVFWKENLKLVDLFLRSIPSNKTVYFFTASTYLDFSDREHYAFSSIGDIHIFDDPLIRQISNLQMLGANNCYKDIIDELKRVIDDNLVIIERCCETILILPLQYLYNLYQAHEETSSADVYFLSLFSNLKSMSNYFSDYLTIQDIERGLSPNIVDAIIFNLESEDVSFCERFKKAKEFYNLDFLADKTDAEIFYFVIRGYLDQSYRTIMLALNYSIFPYLRDQITVCYLMLILDTVKEKECFDVLMVKCIFANAFYNCFDKKRVFCIGYPEYLDLLAKTNFNKLTSEFINSYKKISTNRDINEIVSFIQRELQVIYDMIEPPPTPRTVDPTPTQPDV